MKKAVLIILLVIFPFGQLLRYNLGNGITLHLNDLIVGIVGLAGLIKINGNLKKPVLFWIASMVISLILNYGNYSINEIFISSLYLFRWVAYAGLYFFFKDLKFSSKYLLIPILMVAIAGIGQYIISPDVTYLAAYDWDNHYFRLVSTFLDPGFTGTILVLGLLLIFSQKKISSLSLAMTLIYTAMLLTYSRATYLMFWVGFAAISYFKKSLKYIVLATLVLLLSISFLPPSFGEGTKLAREASIFSRFESWGVAFSLWQKSPIYGIGFDTYRYATNNNNQSHAGAGSDSSILNVLAMTGLVGLLAYLYLLKKLWDKGGYLFKVVLTAVFISSWFNNCLFYPWIMEYLWLFLVFDS